MAVHQPYSVWYTAEWLSLVSTSGDQSLITFFQAELPIEVCSELYLIRF